MIVLPEDPSKHREFICPCGKGYFSYAALFTHVKQKHQGKVLLPPLSPPDRSSSPNPKTNAAGPGNPPTTPPAAITDRTRCGFVRARAQTALI